MPTKHCAMQRSINEWRSKHILGWQTLLGQLTFNDARVIKELTEIAKRNCKEYNVFVPMVEKHLRDVSPDRMLPTMYLIDSMCKNLQRCYKVFFGNNLVSNFAFVFEQVSLEDRSLLHQLRMTWDQVFADRPNLLHQLDLRIKEIDPAWPASPLPSSGDKINAKPATKDSSTKFSPIDGRKGSNPAKQEEVEVTDNDDNGPQRKLTKTRRKCDSDKTYKIVFFHLEFLRSSTSPDLHLTQLAACNAEDSLFVPVLPSILPEYLNKYKVCGDLMKTLTMMRKDDGSFLFRPPILVDKAQEEGVPCASEAEALSSFMDMLDRAGPNIILVCA